ncbi:glutathione S-transferase [Thalassotalea insulae]|uniref:Glutathione S-transferase n=1 Tax=Thalassotalea insulae TaxID=2056778 RepID=A0ABQ6GYC7_9GAMM|nr:glutathione S-transferase family protein [Thalassotalea insulae]GLX79510.1 glutathione S-transferase [Thalassotalea insulae]
MYTLYYSPNACSLATQVILNELNQSVNIIDKRAVTNFHQLSPTGAVPVLKDGEQVLLEGAAIVLHLLEKHRSTLYPSNKEQQVQAKQDILFANATVHPAYSKLFFIAGAITDEQAKEQALTAATENLNKLWSIVEQRLQGQPFLGGSSYSAADIMLTIYSRWNQYFPTNIILGEKTQQMINKITSLDSFIQAVNNETTHSAAFAA